MRKCDELAQPNSCWNKAGETELVFVILGRDMAAAAAIRAWCRERIRRGKNKRGDAQIKEARALAGQMEGDAAISEAHAATMRRLNP